MLTQRELLIQWLGRLSKEEREGKLLEVMDYMADGTIKPPPPSEPFICSPSAACMQLHAALCGLLCICEVNSMWRSRRW